MAAAADETATPSPPQHPPLPAHPGPAVIKGKSDWRQYRPLTLTENGITVLLIHDPQSKTLAASTCVNVGASSDPRSLPGLAHFTEHMCFLGSESYPGENEYKKYLSQHGGQSNASTSMTVTTYKFDVLADYGEGALDRFAAFFTCPLFTESGTGREVMAVDSENSKNLTSDGRRRLQILKDIGDNGTEKDGEDGGHHWCKFSTGNAITLPAAASAPAPAAAAASEDTAKANSSSANANKANVGPEYVRSALLAFHARHYRPSNLTVVVVGPQSLDTLQEWTVPRFASMKDRWSDRLSSIRDSDGKTKMEQQQQQLSDVERMIDDASKDAPPHGFDSPQPPKYNPAFFPALQGGKWPVLLTTLPLQSVRKLVLAFPVPPVQHIPDQSPTSILSHLLGHEGKGSSFAVLQDAGLIDALSAGPRVSGPDQCLFQVSIDLTELGEEKWVDVAAVIFSHCRLISETADKAAKDDAIAKEELERIWAEVAALNSMVFHTTSPGTAYGAAPSLAQSATVRGVAKCLSAGSLLDETADTLPLAELNDFAGRLVPDNCFVERCSKGAWEETKAMVDDGDGKHFGLKKERWYGVEYHLSEISDEDLAKWGENTASGTTTSAIAIAASVVGPLHLPKPNRYIPRTLDLCPDLPEEAKVGPRIDREIDPPKLLAVDCVDDGGNEASLWHRLDDRYALPKSSLTFLLRNASVENVQSKEDGTWSFDVDTSLRSLLLTGVFADAMAQETYDADQAGLYWSLGKSSSGITLSCSGYSDRLPDLALKLLQDFLLPGTGSGGGGGGAAVEEDKDDSFFQESYFTACQDRIVRSLRSYFQAHRADSHAMYYRDLLMSSKGGGVERSLASAEGITLEALKEQHQRILTDPNMKIECLFTGNVSEAEAKAFFCASCKLLRDATGRPHQSKSTPDSTKKMGWLPGPFERRLEAGEEIELHFASKNPEEENGAVLVTFQSQVPGFKGVALSSPESLLYTAAIRVICHMLREPLFDDLRTQQQLGYIVSSYYDVSFATPPPRGVDMMSTSHQDDACLLSTTPIDSIVVNILSRKVSPPEVTVRIDEFLSKFRDTLATMPESEIKDHADALSTKMLKPIQKLGSEASIHYRKILRFGPEVLDRGGTDQDLPWDSVKSLASAIQALEREDILKVWDGVVANKDRSRIVSCVYGTTFPLQGAADNKSSKFPRIGGASTTVLKDLGGIMKKREKLLPYDGRPRVKERSYLSAAITKLGGKKTVGLAAVALIGIGGAVGLTLLSRNNGKREEKVR